MTAQLFVDFKVEKVLNNLKTKCDSQGCIFISFSFIHSSIHLWID